MPETYHPSARRHTRREEGKDEVSVWKGQCAVGKEGVHVSASAVNTGVGILVAHRVGPRKALWTVEMKTRGFTGHIERQHPPWQPIIYRCNSSTYRTLAHNLV